jgi:hypothetical protein
VGTVHDDRVVFVAWELIKPRLKLVNRDQHRAIKAHRFVFLGRSDVENKNVLVIQNALGFFALDVLFDRISRWSSRHEFVSITTCPLFARRTQRDIVKIQRDEPT